MKKFHRHRIVAIVADSGTGKSSLAGAGFAPAFRGGALADVSRDDPDDRIWNVVTMRPRANPEEGLRSGINYASEKLGRTPDERASLRRRADVANPSETAFALQCNLPSRRTATLIIVDQFEELFTQTPSALCAPFVKLLLELADSDKDFRVLLTVRADYFNQCREIRDEIKAADGRSLFDRLVADNRAAILRLNRISEGGLRDVVCEPLRLAGDRDKTAQEALLKAVQREISDQPSDLPLLQVALKAAWREHKSAGLGLLEAYESVGGVLGALAQEAEKVRNTQLSPDDQARLESIFVRLVRLGDTGGATGRTAALDEFDAPEQALLRRLGDDEHGRLLAVSEKSAEIAHEALITQWPWLQGRLKEGAHDVRRLDRLMSKSAEWSEAQEDRKSEYLASGAEREFFDELANERPNWLSGIDRKFVEASNAFYQAELFARTAEEKRKERDQKTLHRRFQQLAAAVAALVCALIVVGYYYLAEGRAKSEAIAALSRAESETLKAIKNQSVALTALAVTEAEKHPVNAAKLALAAWPRDSSDKKTPKLSATLDALGQIVPNLRERLLIRDAKRFAVFSPDGYRVVTGSTDNNALVWEAASGLPAGTLSGHERPVNSAAFNRGGTRIVTTSDDETARLWDAASGRVIATFAAHEGPVNSAVFNRDGTRIVTASDDKTARLWDAASGRVIATFAGHDGAVHSADFSPDGTRVVTASADGTARLWDASTGRAITTLAGHHGPVYSAAFSPDGSRVVTASDDMTARLWDASSGRPIATLAGHHGPVYSAAFSPDGSRVVTASDDKTSRVWDVDSGLATVMLVGHDEAVRLAAFSPDGKSVVTASDDNTVRLWDAGARVIAAFSGHEDVVSSAEFSPDGTQVVTSSADSTARVWDAASGRVIATLAAHEGPVNSAVFNRDGTRIVTTSDDMTARLWDAGSGQLIATLAGHQRTVRSASFSSDGTRVITASDDMTARLWDASSGRAITTLAGHHGPVYSAAFSPDGSRAVTASDDTTARLWDASSGRPIATLAGHHGPVYSAAFSPDGSRVVTASDDMTARLWDASSGRPIATLAGHHGPVYSAAFSPDGSRVVTASDDKTARLWDASSGRSVATLVGHKDLVYSADFSPDGTRIVTASADRTARIWDATCGRAVATLLGQNGEVTFGDFSPDGTRLVTVSRDHIARIWDVTALPNGNILHIACKLLAGNVSLDGVTSYPLTFDLPICSTDPPPPDPEELPNSVRTQ